MFALVAMLVETYRFALPGLHSCRLRLPAFNRDHGIEPKLDAPVAPLDTQRELADDGAPSLHYRADR